ncbi:MAG: response regulator transcription factor [Helicobacteraceae bacterium]|nr:response regulator transcription factor [Candidatus Sulfurimonas ponti]MBL6973026.1 response regulator transcription factor [Sulfurimonas sp.]
MKNPSEIKKYTNTLSILFAEDHEELRVNTSNILKSIFKTVDTCSDGQEAFNQYLRYKKENNAGYDIVLTDIEMPKMDGIELTENIYKENPEQAIIVLSAYDDTHYLLKLINLGVEQFIKKPIDYQELLGSFLNVSKKIHTTKVLIPQNKEIHLSQNISYIKDSKSIKNDGESVYLTKFEIVFLELLSHKMGKIYSNEEIVSHFNALNEIIDGSNIRKLVSKLRKKLPENSLESIYGIGYKLIPYVAKEDT